jgi:hypothetical protein
MRNMNSVVNHHLEAGTVILYLDPATGQECSDRVVERVGEHLIISVPTIGGTWRKKSIHISYVKSYTNTL